MHHATHIRSIWPHIPEEWAHRHHKLLTQLDMASPVVIGLLALAMLVGVVLYDSFRPWSNF